VDKSQRVVAIRGVTVAYFFILLLGALPLAIALMVFNAFDRYYFEVIVPPFLWVYACGLLACWTCVILARSLAGPLSRLKRVRPLQAGLMVVVGVFGWSFVWTWHMKSKRVELMSPRRIEWNEDVEPKLAREVEGELGQRNIEWKAP
jgi:hypothetical protein